VRRGVGRRFRLDDFFLLAGSRQGSRSGYLFRVLTRVGLVEKPVGKLKGVRDPSEYVF
jgi:hypothetical protein